MGSLVCLWGALVGADAAGTAAAESVVVSSVAAAPAARPDGAAELAAKASAPADELTHGVRRHYMWSNERRHDLFFPDLAGLGGGYLGVGGDQNYTMAAAAQAQVLWLIDLDAAVVRMHRLYAALLAAARTPAEFVALLAPAHEQAVYDAVAAYYPQLPEAERRLVLAVYHAYREDLSLHLHKSAEYRWAGQPVTWLGAPGLYDHVRKLALSHLIVPRLGDLTGPTAMQAIAEAARSAGIPLRVLYLSNAESWFHYGRAFRKNLDTLPFDDRSLVLRTVKSELLTYPHGDIWHYSVQSGVHFAQHLRDSDYSSIDVAMLDAPPCYRHERHPGPDCSVRGLSHIGLPPQGPPAPAVPSTAATQSAPAHHKRHSNPEQREQLEQRLAAGLVTRPEGNRIKARQMDREREKLADANKPPASQPPTSQ